MMTMENYSLYSLFFGMIFFLSVPVLVSVVVVYYFKRYIFNLNVRLMNVFIHTSMNRLAIYHVLFTLATTSVLYVLANYPGLMLSLIISSIVPVRIVNYLEVRHKNKFISQLSDVMSSMSAMLKSGTHLNKVLQIVADQHPAPASNEFKVVLSEYKLGVSLEDALNHMAKKIGRQELELTVSAIIIAHSVGGNLSETLDVLSKTLREKMSIEGKIEALTSMGRMQGRVVSLIPLLVFVSLYYQDPQIISQFLNEPYAWFLMFIILSIMVLAMIMIKRISTIHI